MTALNNLLDGMITGLGMWVMMTVLGIFSFWALKKWFTGAVANLWAEIKRNLQDIEVSGSLKTKKKEKKVKK